MAWFIKGLADIDAAGFARRLEALSACEIVAVILLRGEHPKIVVQQKRGRSGQTDMRTSGG